MRPLSLVRMPLIHAYFYVPNATDHVINHLVTKWDPPYAHCDVQFEDGMASSIYSGESVYWRKRGFKKPGYSRITLSVNQADYDRAYRLCQNRQAAQMGFDAVGMYTLPLRMQLWERDSHTFCSKHCTQILQLAGVKAVSKLEPHSTTPSALRRALERSSILHTDRIDLRIEALPRRV